MYLTLACTFIKCIFVELFELKIKKIIRRIIIKETRCQNTMHSLYVGYESFTIGVSSTFHKK